MCALWVWSFPAVIHSSQSCIAFLLHLQHLLWYASWAWMEWEFNHASESRWCELCMCMLSCFRYVINGNWSVSSPITPPLPSPKMLFANIAVCFKINNHCAFVLTSCGHIYTGTSVLFFLMVNRSCASHTHNLSNPRGLHVVLFLDLNPHAGRGSNLCNAVISNVAKIRAWII